MQVNGKTVDVLQWLKDTGGANAIKRFSNQQALAQTDKAVQTNSLSKDETSQLKIQMQYNKAGMAAPAGTTSLASYLSSLKDLQQTPTNQPTVKSTNSVQFSNKTNTSSVNGSFNSVDFNGNAKLETNNSVTVAGEGNIVRGYNGGQSGNTMKISGNTNRLYAGENASNNSATITGGKNSLNLSFEASNNTVAITGNNVKVAIGSQGLTAGSNQNWNINVAASNVDVSVANGQATVSMADDLKDKYKVTIDNTAKIVTITSV